MKSRSASASRGEGKEERLSSLLYSSLRIREKGERKRKAYSFLSERKLSGWSVENGIEKPPLFSLYGGGSAKRIGEETGTFPNITLPF